MKEVTVTLSRRAAEDIRLLNIARHLTEEKLAVEGCFADEWHEYWTKTLPFTDEDGEHHEAYEIYRIEAFGTEVIFVP